MTIKQLDRSFKRDVFRLVCFGLAITAVGIVFLGNPALSLPTVCSIVITTMLSPWVATLERRGFSRDIAILILFLLLSTTSVFVGILVATNWQKEWFSFQAKAPEYFAASLARVHAFEMHLRASLPLPKDLDFAALLNKFVDRSTSGIAARLPAYMGNFFSCIFLVPILTYCLLSEGRSLKRRFFQLVPNRFFESVFIVSHGVGSALSDYLRAKLIEAFLVGIITTIGLAMIHSPYAIVLGIFAGLTNIIPYIGPFLGAIPAIAIASFDSYGAEGLIWSTVIVYAIANIIDSVIIFPGVVAKLVKLPPLVLVASVVLGQYYGGIIGMLISIPIAAVFKVFLSELYVIIYGFVPDP